MIGAPGRIAIIWAAATLLMVPAFIGGHIVSDSSFLNVNWSAAFARELFSGHIYPRWLSQMNEGAGSPVFYFYGPLPFYLTAPFHLIAGPRLAVMLGVWLMLGLSGHAFHALASHFVQSMTALVGAVAYMAMPYHLLVDVWLRADLGEQAAFIFIPLCLLCVFRLASGPLWTFALAASFAGLLLSHLPSALLFAPFLVGFGLYVVRRETFVTMAVRATTAACLSFGLASAYIVPAMLLQGMIHADRWRIFRPSDSVLFNGRPAAFALFLDSLVAGAVFVISIFAFVSIAGSRWRFIAPWTILAGAAVFLVSPIAAPLWNALPAVFDRIQFAWRVLLLLDLAACMVFALTLDSRISRGFVIGQMVFGLAAITILFVAIRSRAGDDGFMLRSAADDETLIAARAEPLEYLPSCRIFRGSDRTDGSDYSMVQRAMAGRNPNGLAVFYYPFLETRVNGELVETRCDPGTGFILVGPHTGFVRIEKRALPPERAGYALSALSILILLLGLLATSPSKFTGALMR